eukprot:1442975-Heterocapsa_arctica.AAC.1
MYHLRYSSSSCNPQLGHVRSVPSSTSASLHCGQVPPARMFLKAPASLGAVASSLFRNFLGMVQSTTPFRPS